MGPFAWLASRWTPEFEYRDRLADEVEDIAYESTRTGAKRGFLLGALAGAILALIGGSVLMFHASLKTLSPADEPQPSQQQAMTSQPSSEDLSTLREENAKLRGQLAAVKAAEACPPCEKRTGQTKQPQPKTEVSVPKPPKTPVTEVVVKPVDKTKAPAGLAAQPIPSNCRQEGDCETVRR
jgi:hypothetical protein